MSTLQQDALFIWWRLQGKKKLAQIKLIEEALEAVIIECSPWEDKK